MATFTAFDDGTNQGVRGFGLREHWREGHRENPHVINRRIDFFVLWALGVFAFKVTAGLIHILLVVALIVGLVQLFRGRRV